MEMSETNRMKGVSEKKMHRGNLQTEQPNPASARIDEMSSREIVALINAEDATVAAAVRTQLDQIAQVIDLAVDRFRRGGHLFYVGAGTSGRLGVLDASECPPTFGTDPELVQGIIAGGPDALVRSSEGKEDIAEDGARALDERRVGPNDLVIGIAACGLTPYVHGALARARELGAATALVTCNDALLSRDGRGTGILPVCRKTEESGTGILPVSGTGVPPVNHGLEGRATMPRTDGGTGILPVNHGLEGRATTPCADVIIAPVVGPEVLAGSTRMKAGTATKMVLNMITTGSMIRLGKCYGNLMVDLRARSDKLRGRAVRIFNAVTGTSDDAVAWQCIQSAGGSVKTAILMNKLNLDRDAAESLLARSDGSLRKALQDAP